MASRKQMHINYFDATVSLFQEYNECLSYLRKAVFEQHDQSYTFSKAGKVLEQPVELTLEEGYT